VVDLEVAVRVLQMHLLEVELLVKEMLEVILEMDHMQVAVEVVQMLQEQLDLVLEGMEEMETYG
jgi:hypothetical protein